MPTKNKRNASSRRQASSNAPIYSDLLLSQSVPVSTHFPVEPTIFDSDLPPSDPEVGRDSVGIRDGIASLRFQEEFTDFVEEMYGPVAGGSDSDDGPASGLSTPPDRSPLRNLAIIHDSQSDDSSAERSAGHTRSPVLARELSTLETFSRTIRNYVPSSIPIPSAAPSPPRVSRPVSFGSFLTPSMSPGFRGGKGGIPDASKRRGSDASSSRPRDRSGWNGQRVTETSGDVAVFSLDDDAVQEEPRETHRPFTRYPGVEDVEEILWAGWDNLIEDNSAKPTCVLMLGYPTGLQIWDCSNLGSISELLNLSGPQWGAVEFARVLPNPPLSAADQFHAKRPLSGFCMSQTGEWPDFLVYSLRTHEVVKRLPIIGLRSFSAAAQFVVLSTSNPSTLHILSSSTFSTLYNIPSTSLVPFAYPSPSAVKNNIVSSLDLEQEGSLSASQPHHHSLPQPVFALSNRLLAFVSPLSQQDSGSGSSATQPHISMPVASVNGAVDIGIGLSQSDLSHAAVKIGGSVLSGMKFLGGMAMSAARARVTVAVAGDAHNSPRSIPGPSGLTNMFSRSAPTASGRIHGHERRHSTPDGIGRPLPHRTADFVSPAAASIPAPSSGYIVSVMDLQSLLSSSTSKPEKVAEFKVSKQQPLSIMQFSADGTSLAVGTKDGRRIRVFQLQPKARLQRSLGEISGQDVQSDEASKEIFQATRRGSTSHDERRVLTDTAFQVYNLRRGHTPGVVQSIEWSNDKLWFAIGSKTRTIHVFAVNPLGGMPDIAGHLSGKVVNSTTPALSTELSALAHLRLKSPSPDQLNVPCAFTFLRSSEVLLPSSLLPPASVQFSASSSPSSIHSGGLSKPVSPTQRSSRPTNYKDVLVFNPNDCALSLYRIFVDRFSGEHTMSLSNAVPIVGGTSISLPGMSTIGRVSATPPSSSSSPRAVSGLTQMMDKPAQLVCKDTTVVSTWHLGRARDWPEVRRSAQGHGRQPSRLGRVPKLDWLSRAELSTCSSSPRVLPRSLYVSHQFAFHALGEDYHALIRSHHFDVSTSKIEVRKAVEVSAYPSGGGESFVQGLSSPRDIGQTSSSFDEPLACALSAEIHPFSPSPPVLPMLPNGTPGSISKSLITAIPIRTVAAGIHDGMSESLIRLRREFGKARSPRLAARPDHGVSSSVPLEFDEEDEDFLADNIGCGDPADDVISRSTSRGEGDSGASISTPSTNMDPLPVEDDGEHMWQGWGPEDQQAIEDAERFDDITVGFMDEEQESMREADKKKMKKRRGARKN
ncbi:hypothetical protein A0H81_14964 [Grifola frondosa]|uniref:BCAS3 WD40 domain-containing protein n=1 Tax=Grifola frondosa TaxID=5627 RepID=A0A1C7LJV3_GRIFR|nr:hypothetical protein A0H81_14964 [Grifola frondosa]